MAQSPGAGKDFVGKVVGYLRQNGGTAVLNGHNLAKGWGCSQTNVSWAIRKLFFCGVITTPDKLGSGRRILTFFLCERFRDGEGWRDVLRDSAPMWDVNNKSILEEKRIMVADRVMDYLRNHNGRAVVKATALAGEWGCSQPAVSAALKGLINKGHIVAIGLTGKGIWNPEFELTEKGRSIVSEPTATGTPKVVSGTARDSRAVRPVRDDDTALKLSMSRELVQVYERLKEAQNLNSELEEKNRGLLSEKIALDARIKELEEELESERRSHHRDANEIATLELQLRELRSATDSNARRIRFDRSGYQVT